MNKQEVIEEIKNLEGLTILDKTINLDSEMIPKGEALEIVNQLDEPQIDGLTKQLDRTQYQLKKVSEESADKTARIAELTENGG